MHYIVSVLTLVRDQTAETLIYWTMTSWTVSVKVTCRDSKRLWQRTSRVRSHHPQFQYSWTANSHHKLYGKQVGSTGLVTNNLYWLLHFICSPSQKENLHLTLPEDTLINDTIDQEYIRKAKRVTYRPVEHRKALLNGTDHRQRSKAYYGCLTNGSQHQLGDVSSSLKMRGIPDQGSYHQKCSHVLYSENEKRRYGRKAKMSIVRNYFLLS